MLCPGLGNVHHDWVLGLLDVGRVQDDGLVELVTSAAFGRLLVLGGRLVSGGSNWNDTRRCPDDWEVSCCFVKGGDEEPCG